MMWTDRTGSVHGRAPGGARRGVMLVLVIFFIFLAGALAVLATAYAVQLARTTRQHHESIVLRQMADSSFDWLVAQEDWRATLPAVRDMNDVVPEGTSGVVRMRADDTRPGTVVIEARIATTHHGRRYTTRLSPPD